MTYRFVSAFVLGVILLAGCAAPRPTTIPTLAVTPPSGSQPAAPVSPASGAVTASAEVVPLQKVDLGFAAPGFVEEIQVSEGEEVQAGDLLASQDNLVQLQSVVAASQQNLASAQKALEDLSTQAPLALATAQQTVVSDQKRYDDAVKKLKRKDYHRCDDDTIDLYFRIYDDAKEGLEKMKENNDGSTYYLQKLREVQSNFDVAEANYLYCLRYTDQEIAESNAELAVAEASLEQSTSRYERLKSENGINPDEAARLKAAIANAEASLSAAEYALDRATIKAPFAGTVISVEVSPGQAVTPGQVILSLANLNPLLVETTDLSERDLSRVSIDQAASVTVAGLGKTFPGKVIRIAPRATKLGGDVVYKVTIQLDEQPADLRWGMSATAQIGP